MEGVSNFHVPGLIWLSMVLFSHSYIFVYFIFIFLFLHPDIFEFLCFYIFHTCRYLLIQKCKNSRKFSFLYFSIFLHSCTFLKFSPSRIFLYILIFLHFYPIRCQHFFNYCIIIVLYTGVFTFGSILLEVENSDTTGLYFLCTFLYHSPISLEGLGKW